MATALPLSIIVPVYKVEHYLPTMLDSILAQTFRDYELLLIDDGSPDDSGKICDDYAVRDERIRVIHKENGGVSSARNSAIEEARGEYIFFCRCRRLPLRRMSGHDDGRSGRPRLPAHGLIDQSQAQRKCRAT